MRRLNILGIRRNTNGSIQIAPNWNDLEGTKKILLDTIKMDVQTVGYDWLLKSKDWKPMVVVNTKINQNAGHRIPDG